MPTKKTSEKSKGKLKFQRLARRCGLCDEQRDCNTLMYDPIFKENLRTF